MKLFIFPLTVLVMTSCVMQKTAVSLQVTYTEQYCGGARPSEELQENAEKNKPYANRTLVFVSQTGKIDSSRTDAQGNLGIKLKKGSYSIFEAWRFNLFTPEDLPIESFDRECLKQEWTQPYGSLLLDKKTMVFKKLNPIIKYCSWRAPCLLQQEIPPGR